VLGVSDRLGKQVGDVWVVERVDDLSAFAVSDDEVEIAQDPELL
jgi:hypothetical protein